MFAKLLVAGLILLPALAAQDRPAPARYRDARGRVQEIIADRVAPSVAVAVIERGEVVWAEGFGHADVASGVAATADTSYRLASISKPFTATTVMRLVDLGSVDLDASVNTYLAKPGVRAYRGRAEDVTLRRLLNHTSGLPTHWSFFYADAEPPPRAESIRRYGFAAWPPGTRTNYSNFAFGILDHVVGEVSGRGYATFLREEVLDPLGMRHTSVGRPESAPAAVGYFRDVHDHFVKVPDYGFDHDGASAIWSSANDLMRFAALQLDLGEVDGRRILAADSIRAMREHRGKDAGSSFGIGWSVRELRDTTALSHTGGMPGVSTALYVLPDLDGAVAVLTNNSDRGAVSRALDPILDVLVAPGPPPGQAAGGHMTTASTRPGTWRGHVAHFLGPIPFELVVGEDARAKVRLGRIEVRQTTSYDGFTSRSLDPERVRLGFRAPLATTPSVHGTPDLALDLAATGDGWQGLLYANVRGVCRLPHWVQLAPKAHKAGGTFRVVTYNVLVGFDDYHVGDPYLPGVQRRAAIATWLAAQAADVVALQELNGFTAESLARVARAWGHRHAVILEENGYPVGLTSRQPIDVVARLREGLHHGLLHARTAGIDFVVAHLVPTSGMERKLAEVEQVLACYRAAHDAGKPVLLLGDFNAISAADVDHFSAAALARYRRWGYVEQDGRPAETAVAPITAAGAVDLWLRHRGESLPDLPLPRIDFVFASPELAARSTACRWLCRPEQLQWSDHPPVVADFNWSAK